MTTTEAKIPRTGPAIREALAQHAPDELAAFEDAFHATMAAADNDFNLARVDAVLDQWWRTAVMRANPLTEEETAMLERARRGDFTGFRAQDEHGNWYTI